MSLASSCRNAVRPQRIRRGLGDAQLELGNDSKSRFVEDLRHIGCAIGKDDLRHSGSVQHEGAFEDEHGRPADDNAVAAILADESAAAARHLTGDQSILA
jgi:hypothetical protein